MKTLRTTLAMVMITLGSLVANAQGPMSFYVMRDNARFLTDRMVHVLNLSTALIDEIYCINYDYIYGVNDYLDDVALGYRYDDYLTVLRSRDAALRLLLTEAQWRLLMSYDYFYRPIYFVDRHWSFGVYAHDRWGGRLFYREPVHYVDYRGGHYFGGMAPTRGVLAARPRPDMMSRGNAPRPNDMNRGGGNAPRPNDMNRGGGNAHRPNDMNRGGGNAPRPSDMNRGGGNTSRPNNMNRGSVGGSRSNSMGSASRSSRPATSNVSMSRSSSSRSMSGGAGMTGGVSRGGRR